jgi:uncharacterized protein YecE (DUF72 family)
MKSYIGTSGWNYPHWKIPIYDNAPATEWLELYSKIFSTVEVNNTFYRWPTKTVLENWYNKTPENFKFTLKAPRTITHKKEPDAEQIKSFSLLASTLKNKLGALLFQFPPRFKNVPENLTVLKKILENFEPSIDNAIEFRDKSWWDKEIFNLLQNNNVAFVNVFGLSMPPKVFSTADFVYVRLHGEHYDTKYTIKELTNISNNIKKLKVKKIYVYFDNDQKAYAPANAREIRDILIE